jgi:hypothetical protein
MSFSIKLAILDIVKVADLPFFSVAVMAMLDSQRVSDF